MATMRATVEVYSKGAGGGQRSVSSDKTSESQTEEWRQSLRACVGF